MLIQRLVFGLCIVSVGFVLHGELVGGEIERAEDAPQAHSVEESLGMFRVAEGFTIELAASEPLLADPVAMAFDERGGIFVSEIHGYNLDGHLEIVELNKTGELDKQVRRIHVDEKHFKAAEEQTYGTVKRLVDTDGDGRMDRADVWADRLPASYGVAAARGGVIVTCAPKIIFLADRDGDGKAEVRETLFEGFGVGELWTRINNPRWGPDNWIYVMMGAGCGGTITGPNLEGEVWLGNTHFRFKADGSALEPVTGDGHGFGLALTDFGDRLFLGNSTHALYAVPLGHRYMARNPYYAGPGSVEGSADHVEVFPSSRPHPWRQARSEQAEWVKFYGSREATANGYLTASCGPVVYRADRFGDAYRGNHFSCESQQNLVHRCNLQRDGAGYTSRRFAEEAKSEFLTSTEGWFRPVNLEVGPEGALYVVDMYREIIEDYSAIPRYLQQQYGLIEGADRGRIWRVDVKGAAKTGRVNLGEATAGALVDELSDANAWQRMTAQRLLIERDERSAVEALRELVKEGDTALGRLHGLYTLAGLGALDEGVLSAALRDPHDGVRVHGLRLADGIFDEHRALLKAAMGMVDDPDPRVRLQLAMSLGESSDARAVEALAGLALRHGGDRWMEAAVMSSVGETGLGLLEGILAGAGDADRKRPFASALGGMIAARRDREEVTGFLGVISSQGPDPGLQAAGLKSLSAGLKRGEAFTLTSEAGQGVLRALLEGAGAEVRAAALQVAGAVNLKGSAMMEAVFASAVKEALNSERPAEDRAASILILADGPFDTLASCAGELLDLRTPVEVQLATVKSLGGMADSGVAGLLLAGWDAHSPRVREAVLDAVFGRVNRLGDLLAAMEAGRVLGSDLSGFRRVQLLENPDDEVRGRAEKVLKGAMANADGSVVGLEQGVIDRFVAALGKGGDATRGRKVFEEQCMACHQVGDRGHVVGPALSSAMSRPDEALLMEILEPSRMITAGFTNYIVTLTDGEILTGLLTTESATSIAIGQAEGKTQTVLRKDIESMRASRLSLMPGNFYELIQPGDGADLLAYLREAFGQGAPASVTLFDEDPEFVEALPRGDGKATIETGDQYSGRMALAVTPPQRYSDRISGWAYRIAEEPAEGEYRYLRMAWKSRGGDGVMVELAANGGWPSSESPVRRYYCGINTTKWEATCVSEDVATDWTVVTVDLWKDCGAFTLTGIAPTAMGGTALFDKIELFRSVEELKR